MSKELEALKNIEKEIEDYEGFDENTYYQMDRTRFVIIEKALKALEIVKKKGVAVGFIFLLEKEHIGGVQEYNDYIGAKELYLTQEEYDLLKEVLK